MDIGMARVILATQNARIRKLNNKRFVYNNFEYRLLYEGVVPAITIERRQIGKRNFKYFDMVDVSRCYGQSEAMELVMNEIKNACSGLPKEEIVDKLLDIAAELDGMSQKYERSHS